jgi:hypothetical protein
VALSIDWPTKVITVPKADTQLVSIGPPEIRALSINNFRLELKGIEASEEGMPELTTHQHNPPVTVGGVTLARVFELINGYTVTFENGAYAVNLNGANSNIGDVVNLNTVSVRSSNSAGLTFSKEIEDQSFIDARVFVNTAGDGLSGTDFPRGTPGDPVDNLVDAQAIIANRGLPKRLFLRGTLSVGAAESVADYDIMGSSPNLSALSFADGANTANLVVHNCDLAGQLQGEITATGISSLSALLDFEGVIESGGLGTGSITLANTGGDAIIQFVKCFSQVAGSNIPTIDCDGIANLELNVRGYHGGLQIDNFNLSSMLASLDFTSGSITIDSTCTAGTIVIRGVVEVTDNSGAGCTVITTGAQSKQDIKLSNNFAVSAANL